MTSYPEAAVNRAAAILHHGMTLDVTVTDIDAALGHHPAWRTASPKQEAELRSRVRRLVASAADVSDFAVQTGNLGLRPVSSHAWSTESGTDFAVQVCAHPNLLPPFQRELVRAAHAAIEATYQRYRGLVPVTPPAEDADADTGTAADGGESSEDAA